MEASSRVWTLNAPFLLILSQLLHVDVHFVQSCDQL